MFDALIKSILRKEVKEFLETLKSIDNSLKEIVKIEKDRRKEEIKFGSGFGSVRYSPHGEYEEINENKK